MIKLLWPLAIILLSSSAFSMFSKTYKIEELGDRTRFLQEYYSYYKDFLAIDKDTPQKIELAKKAYVSVINAADLYCPIAMNILSERLKIPYVNRVRKIDKIFEALRNLKNQGSMHADLELAKMATFEINKKTTNGCISAYKMLTGSDTVNPKIAGFHVGILLGKFYNKNYEIKAFEDILIIQDRTQRLRLLEDLQSKIKFLFVPLKYEILRIKLHDNFYDKASLDQVLELINLGSIRAHNLYGHTLIKCWHQDKENLKLFYDAIFHLEKAAKDGLSESNYWLGMLYNSVNDVDQALLNFRLVKDEEFINLAQVNMKLSLLWQKNPTLQPKNHILIISQTYSGRDAELEFAQLSLKTQIARLNLTHIAKQAKKKFKENLQKAPLKPKITIEEDTIEAQEPSIISAEPLEIIKVQSIASNTELNEKCVKSLSAKKNHSVKILIEQKIEEPMNISTKNNLLNLGTLFKKADYIITAALSGGLVGKQDYLKFINILNKIEGNKKQPPKTNGGSHYKISTEHGKVSGCIKHKSSSERAYTYAIQAVFAKIANSYDLDEITPADLGY